jgi:hypothetical protein
MDLTAIANRCADGTVWLMGVQYRSPDMEPEAREKVFEYAWIKANGLWFGSGSGKVPQAAGWGAVQRWLGERNRRLVWLRLMVQDVVVYDATGPG